jgi:uncharacterized protein (DUF2235 family)
LGALVSNEDGAAAVHAHADGDDHGDGHNGGAPRPPRKYVVFADGTGNAFTKQESNVWRLYEALDRTKPDQVAYYIKGVGTAGWAPLAALDGATGIGVPSNVRKLYRFLCWNWQPGDEIHMFGFSRGSFTARTLAGLISSQGLVPAKFGDTAVSHAEMQRNTMAAWRAYRRETIPWHKSLPTIWLGRIIRDAILATYRFVMGHRSYGEVRTAMQAEGRHEVNINFLGVFDTVEAFGVPVEELRTAIDWAIWPISFRNRVLPQRVLLARHALALDDERTTFHPIRFDHPVDDPRIKEVWFSGTHSDVGGGYPDGTLSFVPLVWMAGELGNSLRFQPGQIDHFRAYQSAIGPMHDSRSGAAVMYRYGPRPIGEDLQVDGGPPVVHFAVVERMLHGCDDYAPVTLPASAKVLLPNSNEMPLTANNTRQAMRAAYEARTAPLAQTAAAAQHAAAADAFMAMNPPDNNIFQQALDTVWWRRFWYFTLLAAIAFLAAWPFVARPIVHALKGPTRSVGGGGFNLLDVITWIDYGVAAVTGPPAHLLQSILPSYAAPWLNIAVFYPFATTLVVIPMLTAWLMNSFLRDRIQERARLAWNRPHRLVTDIGNPTPLLRIGRMMRLYAWPLRMAFTNVLLPGAFLVVIFGTALLAAGRSYFAWRDGTAGFDWHYGAPAFCRGTDHPTPVGEQAVMAGSSFETRNPCWSSGLWLEKDRKYRIWIMMRETDPWFDRTIMSGTNGFALSDHLRFVPVRRWIRAAWFQPVARIGTNADAEQPLQDIDGATADNLPRPLDPTSDGEKDPDKDSYPVRVEDSKPKRNWSTFGRFEPIPDNDKAAAADVWRQQGLSSRMVADFTPAASGELFLYVNDAIQLVPLLGPFDLYYKNNSGSAEVTVQRMPLPPPGK